MQRVRKSWSSECLVAWAKSSVKSQWLVSHYPKCSWTVMTRCKRKKKKSYKSGTGSANAKAVKKKEEKHKKLVSSASFADLFDNVANKQA